MIFHTLVSTDLSQMVVTFCKENGIYDFDCIQTPMKLLSGQPGNRQPTFPG
ncbi:ATP/GTP-binding protein [Lentilactobacillus farraginis DSM 18382 = JCM 14108]|uniref:ATP/GTP-binding protein n=1 Tax=Lentilactobacillus farraginis DSM 18382 = JCM 14108 TaxID=1423743 RepID=X0PG66_9LACO|nr:ATP/GTP-binding protein [Lentilactobacillus farraginis DSM 18382 = JCM 14108]